MTRLQFNMFCKILSATNKALLGDYVFTIIQRMPGIFQLNQISHGTTVTLKVGTHTECVNAAKECIEMMYNITN